MDFILWKASFDSNVSKSAHVLNENKEQIYYDAEAMINEGNLIPVVVDFKPSTPEELIKLNLVES